MKHKIILFSFLLIFPSVLPAQKDSVTIRDISYVSSSETDTYRKERCKLDIYKPGSAGDYPTVVFFYGGALEMGEKYIPEAFKSGDFVIVAPNYRLSPEVKNPAYTEDAAEAVAWVFKHIDQYGGSKDKIYVCGHSAGGYLTLMIALDTTYLAAHNEDADHVKAWFPISGQTVTHYTIRKERGLSMKIPLIDTYAPLNHARKGTPHIGLITADKRYEQAGRYEENALLKAVLNDVENEDVTLYELQGFNHANIVSPAVYAIMDFINSDCSK